MTPRVPESACNAPAGSLAPRTRARKPELTGMALAAAQMPENGSRGSLDYALRKMLDGFPQILHQHNSDSRRAHPGFPDWLLAGPGGILVRELKRENTHPTPLQQAWLDAFTASGFNAGVWRPSSLLDGTVARELALIAGLRVEASR